MDFSTVDNSVINDMALQFAIILIVMFAVGFAFGAPNWLFKPFITLGVLVGMYFIFQILY